MAETSKLFHVSFGNHQQLLQKGDPTFAPATIIIATAIMSPTSKS